MIIIVYNEIALGVSFLYLQQFHGYTNNAIGNAFIFPPRQCTFNDTGLEHFHPHNNSRSSLSLAPPFAPRDCDDDDCHVHFVGHRCWLPMHSWPNQTMVTGALQVLGYYTSPLHCIPNAYCGGQMFSTCKKSCTHPLTIGTMV